MNSIIKYENEKVCVKEKEIDAYGDYTELFFFIIFCNKDL